MGMSQLEWRPVTPEGLIRGVDDALTQLGQNEYPFQLGLKDSGFRLDEDRANALGLTPCLCRALIGRSGLYEGVLSDRQCYWRLMAPSTR